MKVSVVIPTFNRAALVRETIDSVLAQSYKDYEIIVVDDGSTDDTEKSLLSYRDRITYIKQDNAGINAARNTALRHAKGEYIALLDSDDLWLDFKLSLEVEILDTHPDIGFVFEDFFVFKAGEWKKPHGIRAWYPGPEPWQDYFEAPIDYEPKALIAPSDGGPGPIKLYRGCVYHKSLHGPSVLPSASLYRRSAAGSMRFNEEDSTCGDWEFFARLSKTSRAIFIDTEFALNRSHEDAVRLTRVDQKIQLPRKIALINRVWKQDKDFVAKNTIDVETAQLALYKRLIALQMFESDRASVKNSLQEVDQIAAARTDRKIKAYRLIASTPGSIQLLKWVRGVKHLLHDAKQHGFLKAIKGFHHYLLWKYDRFAEKRFDKKFGVDTGENGHDYLKDAPPDIKDFAVPYEPIQHEVFRKMISELALRAEDTVFVDLGSGKGRALLYAAELPFKRLVGVEFSAKLSSVAEQNVIAYKNAVNTDVPIELLCIDAASYELPKENIVLFLYNPFSGPVMEKVVKKISAFIESEDFDITVLYRNPECSDILNNVDGLELRTSNSTYNIYEKS